MNTPKHTTGYLKTSETEREQPIYEYLHLPEPITEIPEISRVDGPHEMTPVPIPCLPR